ncbi:hypothetical protein M8C21_010639, partial [Ambrosia artemisiifolia]
IAWLLAGVTCAAAIRTEEERGEDGECLLESHGQFFGIGSGLFCRLPAIKQEWREAKKLLLLSRKQKRRGCWTLSRDRGYEGGNNCNYYAFQCVILYIIRVKMGDFGTDDGVLYAIDLGSTSMLWSLSQRVNFHALKFLPEIDEMDYQLVVVARMRNRTGSSKSFLFGLSTGKWVEMMAPVFSKEAWQCVWYMIQVQVIKGKRAARPAITHQGQPEEKAL